MELIKGLRGVAYDLPANASDSFALPVDTPYGNLSLTLLRVCERLGHANKRIISVHETWAGLRSTNVDRSIDGLAHWLVAEEAVFMMKRAADELIAMRSILIHSQKSSTYPLTIEVDRIGRALDEDVLIGTRLYSKHETVLRTLNVLANTHKHSFVNANFSVIGRDEPCVVALDLKYGDLNRDVEEYIVSLDELVNDFNHFLGEALSDLRQLGQTDNEPPMPGSTRSI